ncbi:PTS sugar transporter subunit IIA [Staphylococcus cohnii]|uniref:PTS sugar transporter subunit IIA n=1 Tax=Staphylococcus cohnii TaxID=29382 RepID=UPI003D7EDBFA
MKLFNSNNVIILNKNLDWEESIKIAAKPLLKNKSIEVSYVDAMIDSVNKFGSYIVVAPHIALAHARPEDGVNKIGVSLLKNEKSINFNIDKNSFDSEKEVYLVLVLAAVDNSSHLNILKELAHLMDSDEKIKKIINANDENKLIKIINNISTEEE